jgi:hypothetical protein
MGKGRKINLFTDSNMKKYIFCISIIFSLASCENGNKNSGQVLEKPATEHPYPDINPPDCSFKTDFKLNDSVSVTLGFNTYGNDTCRGHFYASSYHSAGYSKLKFEDVVTVLNSRFKKLEDSIHFKITSLACPPPTMYSDNYSDFYNVFSKSEKWKKFYAAYKKYPEKYKSQFRVDYELIENIMLESNLYESYFKVFEKEGYRVKRIMIEKVDLIPIEAAKNKIEDWNFITPRALIHEGTELEIPFPASIDVGLEKVE